MDRVILAITLELFTAGVGVAVIIAVSAWEPVRPGVLPTVTEFWILVACLPPFFVGGLGWFCVGALRTAALALAIRVVVAVVMIMAVSGAHLYGCEPDYAGPEPCVPGEPSAAEMGVFRTSRAINVWIPVASAALIASWAAVSLMLPPQRRWADRV